MDMAVHRIGLVGCGNIAEHHIRGMSHCRRADGSPRVLISAFADPSAERRQKAVERAREAGVLGEPFLECASLADVPESAVDALLLCVPHDLHETLCEEALRRGPCIVEKPIAPTAAAARRVLAMAAASGHVLFVAENSAFW
jgi:UDP-N-acetyl-2-amino-2-deoxyglucuronate dehydrogenase